MSTCTRLILAAALVFASLPASAQTITGTITGIVKDASGGVLPGATVTMTQLETNRQETAVSDAEGRYASGPLPLGTYRLEASLTGFKSAMRSGVTLTIDEWRGSTSRSKSAPCRKSSRCQRKRRSSIRTRPRSESWSTTAASPSCRSTRATSTRSSS